MSRHQEIFEDIETFEDTEPVEIEVPYTPDKIMVPYNKKIEEIKERYIRFINDHLYNCKFTIIPRTFLINYEFEKTSNIIFGYCQKKCLDFTSKTSRKRSGEDCKRSSNLSHKEAFK